MKNKTSIIFLVVVKVKVPKKDYHIAKDYNSQNSNMDYFFFISYLTFKITNEFYKM